ncbi:MAG TPA: hypothetical protein VLI90_03405 [Tepidisphaeraceae bacterium]|nr:hypothetical protein [Tepidisphaeraceae bacterium]
MKLNWSSVRARRVVVAGAAVITAAVLSSAAPAAVITGFSGNTQPSHNGTDSATVNFAVFDRTGGTAGDTFDTGLSGFDSLFVAGSSSAALDTSAKYLYLYQTVANGDTNTPVFQNTVGVVQPLVSSFGSFTGTKFSTTVLGTPAGFGNTSPASVGATPVILSGQSGLTSGSISDGASSVKALYLTEVPVGGASTLWGYTSNYAPALGNTAILETTGANGTAATAVPEPTAAFGAVVAAIGLCTGRRKRRA